LFITIVPCRLPLHPLAAASAPPTVQTNKMAQDGQPTDLLGFTYDFNCFSRNNFLISQQRLNREAFVCLKSQHLSEMKVETLV